jgi:hypothetical protein
MKHKLLFASTALLTVAVASPASATPPTRVFQPSQPDVTITDQCAFAVLAHIDGSETITTYTNRDGVPVKQTQIFPGNRLTFTNLESGVSVTVMGTGATIVRTASVGGVTVQIAGHGPFVPHPLTGEPGIWYLSGQARATFDADDNLTSAVVAGQLENLCPQLAG